ncbi:sn-glycerol-1-phosphate dehydrogenase [Actinomyces mediterranea]|uniref:sn-glycerol-1-phosphate dehydrogenase n=1 Tax=Actinomyces mediterranea TaxID=1871028 RepID=UPI0009706460|nr:sn-glycerol-1-phosphate dehydrogenase [Actinomyces mediterranea]
MSSTLITRALETATDTRDIIFGMNVLERTGDLFARVFPGARALVVADDNTFAAAGRAVVASLAAAGVESVQEPYIFPGTPTLYADYDNVEILREHIRPLDNTVVCSIAAGTLNDIAKLASGELGRPYMNVCTAPSVDGYASFGASISKDGFKITRDCPAPAALVADLGVIAACPKRLIATGYGDLIEKIPAGADWIIADELGIEPIDDYVWGLVQGPLADALKEPGRIGEGDPEAIRGLAEGNIMSGLAMQAAQSSRPASGAGHQFSHVWEMEGHGLDWEPPLSHGMKVGIGTVASCAIWERALAIDMDAVDAEAIVAAAKSDEQIEARVRALLIPRIAQEAVTHSVFKNLTGDELRERVRAIRESWPRIVERVRPQLITADEAAARLKAVGAPYHPEMIGIDMDRFRQTHFKAQMIRPRYTIIDLLTDLGMFEEVVDGLFAPDGYWGAHPHPEQS